VERFLTPLFIRLQDDTAFRYWLAFVNDLKSKSKSKSLFHKSAINRKFEPNSEVLVKAFGGSKFNLKGNRAIVIKQLDNHSCLLRYLQNNRVFRCSTSRISPIATEVKCEEEDTYVPIKEKELRRSKRVSFAPQRYGLTS